MKDTNFQTTVERGNERFGTVDSALDRVAHISGKFFAERARIRTEADTKGYPGDWSFTRKTLRTLGLVTGLYFTR